MVDGASNMKGSNNGIVLEGHADILIEQVLTFEFKAKNNQAKYETLIVDMVLALEMGVSRLMDKSDSQLIGNHVTGKYHTKEP